MIDSIEIIKIVKVRSREGDLLQSAYFNSEAISLSINGGGSVLFIVTAVSVYPNNSIGGDVFAEFSLEGVNAFDVTISDISESHDER